MGSLKKMRITFILPIAFIGIAVAFPRQLKKESKSNLGFYSIKEAGPHLRAKAIYIQEDGEKDKNNKKDQKQEDKKGKLDAIIRYDNKNTIVKKDLQYKTIEDKKQDYDKKADKEQEKNRDKQKTKDQAKVKKPGFILFSDLKPETEKKTGTGKTENGNKRGPK